MKNRIFLSGLLLLFLAEFAFLTWFALPKEEAGQDAVAVNEILQTVQRDWACVESHRNSTGLDYVVLGADGTVLYRTRVGLSESVNAAVRHRDTILDVETGGEAVGKILIYNDEAVRFQTQKRELLAVVMVAMLLQCCLCAGYFVYMQGVVIKPFHRMKDFARRVAGGDLDVPLQMDRQNLFGAFTESFDLMRSELKKARLAEARANADKRELVAKLSHDIRTPVASIKAAAEVGAALAPDEKSRANYGQIIRKADQINSLVTNLFSAALEELHELSVTPTEWESGQVRTLLENADYLHRAVIPPIPDCVVFADRLRLQQVFDNIFSNSYKYAGTKIEVTACVREGSLAVSVEDYGGGVDGPELPFLKEKFRRGSNAKDVEGAGLGLSVSEDCMKKMGGRLTVENGAAGLRVTVWIGLSQPDALQQS